MIETTTDPKAAAMLAFEACEYATMHPSQFTERERLHLELALTNLLIVVESARGVC